MLPSPAGALMCRCVKSCARLVPSTDSVFIWGCASGTPCRVLAWGASTWPALNVARRAFVVSVIVIVVVALLLIVFAFGVNTSKLADLTHGPTPNPCAPSTVPTSTAPTTEPCGSTILAAPWGLLLLIFLVLVRLFVVVVVDVAVVVLLRLAIICPLLPPNPPSPSLSTASAFSHFNDNYASSS